MCKAVSHQVLGSLKWIRKMPVNASKLKFANERLIVHCLTCCHLSVFQDNILKKAFILLFSIIFFSLLTQLPCSESLLYRQLM